MKKNAVMMTEMVVRFEIELIVSNEKVSVNDCILVLRCGKLLLIRLIS